VSGPAASLRPAPVPAGAAGASTGPGAADPTDPRLAAALERATAELATVLRGYHESTGCHSALWTWGAEGPAVRAVSRYEPPLAPPAEFPLDGGERAAETADGAVRVAAVRGLARTWLVVGPCDGALDDLVLLAHARFLVPAVAQLLSAVVEAEQAARELGERYEEINLLYTISETLGRAVSMEENARTILAEVSETVSASRAAIYCTTAPPTLCRRWPPSAPRRPRSSRWRWTTHTASWRAPSARCTPGSPTTRRARRPRRPCAAARCSPRPSSTPRAPAASRSAWSR
jgi:hypothetical protein